MIEKTEKSKKNLLTYSFCNYWVEAAREFSDIKKITLAGMFLALSVALQAVSVPVDPTGALRIQVTFIVSALSGLVLGPLVSCVRGVGSDIIGFLIFPQGPFFPGYTLSAALGAMIYSLFFWKRRITSSTILAAKLTVNIFVNAMLGSVWSVICYGTKAYSVYFGFALVKNLVLLPIEVLIVTLTFRAMMPVLTRFKLSNPENLESLRINKTQTIIACIAVAVMFIALFLFGNDLYNILKNFVNMIFT